MAKCFADEVNKVDDFLRESTSKKIRETIINLLKGLRTRKLLLPDDETDFSNNRTTIRFGPKSISKRYVDQTVDLPSDGLPQSDK